MKVLIIFYSYHHKNTEKVAKVIAQVLDAEIITPDQVNLEDIQDYDLVGFGSGIYGAKHHEYILDLVDNLPQVTEKKAFIFSTCAIIRLKHNHATIREKLESKGYTIVDDFSCKGFNTNSFIKYFGGMNKRRPNSEDLQNAEEFALNLIKNK